MKETLGTANASCFAIVLLVVVAHTDQARAADDAAPKLERPKMSIDRWREDWSSLAAPDLRRSSLDSLKYIPLSDSDPHRYLSLGLTVREIYELSDAPALGSSPSNLSDSYWLQRAQFHVDARFGKSWQLFTQIEDVRAIDKKVVSGSDENKLDLRLAFLGYSRSLAGGDVKVRVGRQDFVFDLERFMSSREGPNVRQSFDAVWAGWETEKWRLYALISQPVQYRSLSHFDDTSTSDLRLSGARIERQLTAHTQLTGYYALYQRSTGRYLDASGEEDRQIVDVRFVGNDHALDWDLETMGQFGKVGGVHASAWAMGARVGYTLVQTRWSPRIGLQVDAASGDRRAGDGKLGTFNPLFPNGFYFSLGGHTGYSNLVHFKPSLSIKPTDDLTLMAGVAALWRHTRNDAIYTLPSVPVPRTAGQGNTWTGAYLQVRADYRLSPSVLTSVEIVRYDAGATLRAAGAHDSEYVRLETKLSW